MRLRWVGRDVGGWKEGGKGDGEAWQDSWEQIANIPFGQLRTEARDMEAEVYDAADARAAAQRNDRAKRAREPTVAPELEVRRLTSRQEAMRVDEGKVMRVILTHALAKRAATMVARAGGAKRQRSVTGGKRKRGAGGDERPSGSDSI